MGGATVLFGFSENVYMLFLLALIAAIGDSILVPAILAAFDQLSTNHSKGRISSVVNVVEDFGYLTAPLLAGVLAYFFGFSVTFALFGAFILLIMVIAFVVKIKV